MDRRQFLQVAGTTSAAVTVAGCSSGGSQKLVPYFIPVEELTPGVSAEFATVCRECPAGCGMIARVRDGRAHKLEGNPDHPVNEGKLCLRGHTALQGLYNPDRFRGPMARDPHGRLQPISWEEAERRLDEALQSLSGRAAWIGRIETGTLDGLIDRWLGALAPNHTRLALEPLADEPLREAAGRVFGRAVIPDFRIERARMLLCFGAEFLETWISNVEYARAFSRWRQARVEGKHRSRYVFIGSRQSLTGANADEWISVRPGTEAHVARALELLARGETSEVGALAHAAGITPDVVSRLAREFTAERSGLALPLGISGWGSDVVAGNEAVLRLNEVAGAVGETLVLDRPHALTRASSVSEIQLLIAAMRAGEVQLLFLHGADPAYHVSGFAEAARKVPHVISLSSYPDETTALAGVVLPDHTPLESWGEYSPRSGTTGLMQPVLAPVFDTRPLGDVLLASARRAGHDLGALDFRSLLRTTYQMEDTQWEKVVGRGVIGPNPPAPFPTGEGGAKDETTAVGTTGVHSGGSSLGLVLYPSLHLYDGRVANRPWAQEIPDPVAKAVWSSWAELHPEAAHRLGVSTGDLLRLETKAGRIDVPALVTDRVHPETVAVQIGQGRGSSGRYASGSGENALRLRDGDYFAGIPVSVTRLEVRRPIPVLQTSERQLTPEIARQITLPELAQLHEVNPKSHEEDANPSLYRYEPPGTHHWGMAIDLDRCIGCNACVGACYAENNVPLVGKEECLHGREMAWIRIENYQHGPKPPVFLPMLCQQCNDAPCEYVCPVNATVHSSEGLNQQVYNRCVGTRFCSNNCPYKVRRFNWFTYEFPEPLNEQLNPDVLRRTKGVMEKCTFCVQRIRRAKIDAGAEHRPIRDGELQTACQQTCPTEAIVFGDLKDPGSRVSLMAKNARGYGALSELNTYPNVTYLKRVRAD